MSTPSDHSRSPDSPSVFAPSPPGACRPRKERRATSDPPRKPPVAARRPARITDSSGTPGGSLVADFSFQEGATRGRNHDPQFPFWIIVRSPFRRPLRPRRRPPTNRAERARSPPHAPAIGRWVYRHRRGRRHRAPCHLALHMTTPADALKAIEQVRSTAQYCAGSAQCGPDEAVR